MGWKVAFDVAQAKETEAAEKAAAELKQKRIDEGGMSGTFEWIAFEAVDKPYIAIPIVLLVFFALFKICFGKSAEDERAEEPAAEADAKAEDNDEAEVVKDEGAQAEGLRQRKKAEVASSPSKRESPLARRQVTRMYHSWAITREHAPHEQCSYYNQLYNFWPQDASHLYQQCILDLLSVDQFISMNQ